MLTTQAQTTTTEQTNAADLSRVGSTGQEIMRYLLISSLRIYSRRVATLIVGMDLEQQWGPPVEVPAWHAARWYRCNVGSSGRA